MAIYPTTESVPLEWVPEDVILDLYEVRQVTEGFGEAARVKPYHEGGFGRVYKVWHRGWQREMAVKSPRRDQFVTQRQKDVFARECETWANLGLHPNVATCHYVRQLGGVPRVFSEYADAGTLEDWIRSRRLYDGDERTALARMLDAAIQFAWGLHYAHERGVIHQDVKPLNALMWDDGTLKVTDFGLSGARKNAGLDDVAGETTHGTCTFLVSSGALTPAFCSPEQASGKKTDRRTDIWSWALCVLEMFQGQVVWQWGGTAAEVLELLLSDKVGESYIPPLPGGVAALLRKCFRRNPSDRPRALHDCAEALCEIYEDVIGTAYPRVEPTDIDDIADMLNNRALSFIDLGNADEAERLFDRALERDSHHVAATYNRGLLLWRSGKCLSVDVAARLQGISQDLRDSPVVRAALGWVKIEEGDGVGGRRLFSEALKLGESWEAREGLKKAASIPEVTGARWAREFKCEGELVSSCISAVFSPDGHSVLVALKDRGQFVDDDCEIIGDWLELLDLDTGRRTRRFTTGFPGASYRCGTFSPDGHLVLAGGRYGGVRQWEAATGGEMFEFEDELCLDVTSLQFSPDGHYLVCGLQGDDSAPIPMNDARSAACVLVDAGARCVLREFHGHKRSVTSVAFAPDGCSVISGSRDRTVRLWDVKTGECLRVFDGFDGAVNSVAFAPDGRFFVSASGATLSLFETGNGRRLWSLRRHSALVTTVAYSPDGRMVISGGKDGKICFWKADTGQRVVDLDGHDGVVTSVTFSPDGGCALSAGADRTVRLWDISTLTSCCCRSPWFLSDVPETKALSIHDRAYKCYLRNARGAYDRGEIARAIALLKKARSITGFAREPTALRLQADIGSIARIQSYRGHWLRRRLEGHQGCVCSISFSPDGQLAVSGGEDRTTRLWDVSSGACLCVIEGHADAVSSVAFTPSGLAVVTGSADGSLRLWDVVTRESLCVMPSPIYGGGVICAAISPDGQLVASGEREGVIRLWLLSTGACVRVLSEHHAAVNSVGFSPDGRCILSGSDDKTIRVWDTQSGESLKQFAEPDHLQFAICSSDGEQVLSGRGWGNEEMGYNFYLRLLDMRSGRCLRTFLRGEDPCVCASYISDSRFAVVGSGSAIYLFDTTHRCRVRRFAGDQGCITSVATSRDGRLVLAGSSKGALRLWEIDWDYGYDPAHDPILTRRADGRTGAPWSAES